MTALALPARPSLSTSVLTTRLMLLRPLSRSAWPSSVELPREPSRWPEPPARELDATRLSRLRNPRPLRSQRSQRPRSPRRQRRPPRSQLPRNQRRLLRSQLPRRPQRSPLPRRLLRNQLPRRLPPRRSKSIFISRIQNPTGPFQDQQHKQKETHQPNLA